MPDPHALTIKNIAATIIIDRRPYLSAMGPRMTEPAAIPISSKLFADLLTAARTTGTSATGTDVAAREARLKATSKWEAPTLLELLNLGGRREEDILEPNAEARRLASKGLARAPVNPEDQPVIKKDDDGGYVSPGEQYEPKFPYGNQKKGSGGG